MEIIKNVLRSVLILSFFISCNTESRSIQNDSSMSDIIIDSNKIEIFASVQTPDTLLEIKNIGLQILNGKAIDNFDEAYLYMIMRNVTTKDSLDRVFYFKVFNRIRNQAKEWLRYEIDFYAKDFCLYYPNEFFSLPDSILNSYASDIGELIRTQEELPEEYIVEFYQNVKSRCNPTYYDKIDNFYDSMKQKMESRK